MSLYLPDQKLGSHSQPGSSSHKFILKGRQTGSMHRGHSWVFRAESYDTMLAWYEDIKSLTEKSGEERNAFVRRHARSVSQGSVRSVSDSGSALDEDEADEVPYSANAPISGPASAAPKEQVPQRPSPGGRFPSDIQVDRHLQAPLSTSSGSSEIDQDLTTAAGGLQNDRIATSSTTQPQILQHIDDINTVAALQSKQVHRQQHPTDNTLDSGLPQSFDNEFPVRPISNTTELSTAPQGSEYRLWQSAAPLRSEPLAAEAQRHDSTYGEWMAPAAGGAVGGLAGFGASKGRETNFTDGNLQANSQPVQEQYQNIHATTSGRDDTVQTPGSEFSDKTGQTTLSAVSSEPGVRFGSTANHSSPPMVPGSARPVFPGMTRNDTDFSVSDLHVPGEFPKPAKTG